MSLGTPKNFHTHLIQLKSPRIRVLTHPEFRPHQHLVLLTTQSTVIFPGRNSHKSTFYNSTGFSWERLGESHTQR